jgi:uncharacterized protein
MKLSFPFGSGLLAALLMMGALELRAAPDADVPPIVSPATSMRHPGKFIWADLVTTDPDAAINFYTRIFGWTARMIGTAPNSYTLLLNSGRPIAGVIYRKADPARKESAAARWVGYISVANMDKAVAAVTAAGGRVLIAPRKVGSRGWQAIVADSENSPFGLIVSASGDPGDTAVADNSWFWVQLFSRKPPEVAGFYHDALDYIAAEDTRKPGAGEFLLWSEGRACAAVTPLPEGKNGRPGWLGYVRVAQLEKVTADARALGSHVLAGPLDGADGMRVAIIADPLGGAIGIVGVAGSSPVEDKK